MEIPLFLCVFGEKGSFSHARVSKRHNECGSWCVFLSSFRVCVCVCGWSPRKFSSSLCVSCYLQSEEKHSLSPDGGKKLSRARIKETRTWIILCISLYLCSGVCEWSRRVLATDGNHSLLTLLTWSIWVDSSREGCYKCDDNLSARHRCELIFEKNPK